VSWFEVFALFGAGTAAGTINTIVGSGSLVTFPTLLAFGVPPVVANVTNTLGLVPGSLSGAIGYRRELRGQRRRVLWLGSAALLGGAIGAVLLLWLPAEAFKAIVPALILLGCLLVILGPRISRANARRAQRRGGQVSSEAWWLWPCVTGTGVYGGYFGAAQGVILMALLGIGMDDDIQRQNGLKNVLAMLINGIAAIIFVFVSQINWAMALTLALGSVLGGQIGASVGRRLPAAVLRAFIVVVGLSAVVLLLVD
jgi:uncharacterized membrane protein YfcA